ncbi:sensor domain-containing diguanylate cyclase [Paenibacillus solanacearum]|nr:sensor domain-containing diguanylate cyclase [Paenibacillus solanacearum]
MILHKGKRRIRLVYLLTGLVFLSVLGTSLVQIFAAYRAEKLSLYETTLGMNHESAQKMAVTMNTLFLTMKNSLRVTAAQLEVEQPQILQKQLNLFTDSSGYFNSVVYVDKAGTLQAISPVSSGNTGLSLTSEAVKTALELRMPTISRPYMSTTNRLIVLMTNPIYNDRGEYIGFLGGTIYLREPNVLSSIFGTNVYSDSGNYVFVVDGTGNIIYHPDQSRLGDNVKGNAVVEKLMQGRHGEELVVNSKGVSFLAGYANSSENGWGIVVQTPLSEIESISLKLIGNMLLYSLPLFVVFWLITLWLAKTLAAPFSSLTDMARDLLNGKRYDRFPKESHWNYEAHHLNKTILLAIEAFQRQEAHLHSEAQTDSLTGLANRRTMDARMGQWVQDGVPFSVIAMDIDDFKKINDSYGHPVGDEVLKLLAKIIVSLARKEDCCCRTGGEEFIVLLPDVPIDAAFRIAEKIRQKLRIEDNPTGLPVTISLGVAAYPDGAASAKDAIRNADSALYAAKRSGKNRTVKYTAGSAFGENS